MACAVATRRGQTDARYWNGRGPHGGWLAAQLLREMRMFERPDLSPRSLSVDFMERLQPGRFDVELQIAARHRHASFLHANLLQAGRRCVHATAVLTTAGCLRRVELDPQPPGHPFDHPRVEALAGLAAFPGMFDYRIAEGWPGRSAGRAHTHGFLRPRVERHITPEALVMLADAWFPAVWAAGEHVPAATVSMSVIFTTAETSATLGPDDYLRASFTTSALAGNFGDETGALWWPDGRLAVKSQQLLRFGTSPHQTVGAAPHETEAAAA